MKKKVLAILIAVVLVATLCSSLVACNNDGDNNSNGLAKIKISANMTNEEILAELEKVKSVTLEIFYNDNPYYTFKMGQDFSFYSYTDMESDYSACAFNFFEGYRGYKMYAYKETEDGETEYESNILDFTGYDAVDLSVEFEEYLQDYLDLIKSILENEDVDDSVDYEITIENGKISITYGVEDEKYAYVYSNFNNTEMPSLPEEFKNYKTMDANVDVIEYELSDDETYYVLSDINNLIKTYEVPETYNGKPVKEFAESCYSKNLKTLTLPTSIVKMYRRCDHDAEDGELHIIYKGTKAQWEQVENHEKWSADKGVRVTCSDGDYVETTTEE